MDVDNWTHESRISHACMMCDDVAVVAINGTWYCVDHCHLGFAASVRVRASAAGLDADEAEAEMVRLLHELSDPQRRHKAHLESIPDGARWSWTQACCERCWIDTESTYEDNILVGLRVPIINISSERGLDCCAWCGEPTFIGIYKRADPATVPYPGWEVDEGSE